VSLFGAATTPMRPRQLDLPHARMAAGQLLQGERETLGHYLSGHPFDPYRHDVRSLVGHDLGDLDRIWTSQPSGEKRGWRPEVNTVVAGLVVGVRRKGDSQVFVQLEDGKGRIECSAFSERWPISAPDGATACW
jgi:DNA polymerase-3 subunit alpha